jgi:hypothetical protein
MQIKRKYLAMGCLGLIVVAVAATLAALLGGGGGGETRDALEILSDETMRNANFVTVIGTVKNISGETLENIVAVVTFKDSDGNTISTAEQPIDYPTLERNQTSGFSATADAPGMEDYEISFTTNGGALPTKR